ncbi:radical SAM protein [Bacteroides bouchesdurhonensis]
MDNNKKYRCSVYNIPVELEDEANKTLLIHGYTGAMDIASEAITECLTYGQEYDISNFPLSEETFKALIARGYLTDRSEEEEYEYVRRFSNIFNRCEQAGKKGFTFMMAYNCNFRCPYCYETEISRKGRQWSSKVFTKEMIDRAYQAMEEIEPNRDNIHNTITLYGGEPLMATNKDIITYTVEKGKSKGYSFHAVTNGYDLDNFLDLLAPDKIQTLQITVDGEKEYHDKRRTHHIYGKSFDKIMNNINEALKTGVRITVRANTDGHNFDSMQRLKQVFRERGFYNFKTFYFYTALLCDPRNKMKKQSEGKDEERERHNHIDYLSREKMVEKLKKEKFPFAMQNNGIYNKIYNALVASSKIRFNAIFCCSQSNSYILDPYGEIYTCWDTVGKRERVLGNYLNSIVWNKKELEHWHTRNISTISKCKECKYALFCGGGCMGLVLNNDEDFTSNICDGYPTIFKIYAALAYKNYSKEQTK